MMRVVRILAAFALLAAALPAAAYIRETTGADPRSGTCQWWRPREIRYEVNASGVTNTDCAVAEAEAATKAAFDAWNAVTCSNFSFDPAAIPTTSYAAIGRDGRNLVVFRRGRCGFGGDPGNCWNHDAFTTALTTTTYDARTGEILDSDIELFALAGSYGRPFTCANIATNYDIQAVVTHEAGHMLGLDHPCEYRDGSGNRIPGYPECGAGVPDAVMWPNVGSVEQRALTQDDENGICSIYPQNAATLTCPPIEDDSGGGCSTGSGGGLAVLVAAAALAASRLLRRRRCCPRE